MRSVAITLVVANVVVYLLQGAADDHLLLRFALWPIGSFPVEGTHLTVGFRPWQLVTSAFLHGSTSHIALNMLGLWMFGRDVEIVLGPRRFLAVYAGAVLAAGLAQLAVVSAGDGPPYPTVGASGGVFGVMLAFAMLFPRRTVMLMFPPVPMPAWLLVAGYAAIELWNGVLGTREGIAHFAHLGGMVGAWLVLRRWTRRRRAPEWS